VRNDGDVGGKMEFSISKRARKQEREMMIRCGYSREDTKDGGRASDDE
jgi:hypothetical protein